MADSTGSYSNDGAFRDIVCLFVKLMYLSTIRVTTRRGARGLCLAIAKDWFLRHVGLAGFAELKVGSKRKQAACKTEIRRIDSFIDQSQQGMRTVPLWNVEIFKRKYVPDLIRAHEPKVLEIHGRHLNVLRRLGPCILLNKLI